MKYIIETLKNKKIDFKENVDLKDYSTIKISAKGRLIVFPKNISEIKQIIKLCTSCGKKYFVIGSGSNLVFFDCELIFIKLKNLNYIKQNKNTIIAGSNAYLNEVCTFARNKGLSGLEGLYFLPARIGGATVMNARAFGCEIKDYIKSVKAINSDGKVCVFSKEQCNFFYKNSIFKGQNFVIVEVVFALKLKQKLRIAKKMEEVKNKRLASQPKGFSAGCVFKNSPNIIAGKVIQSCGFAGYKYRNFIVSDKHCNFIINLKNGKSKDLKKLIEKIKKRVYTKTKIILEEEVILVGEK